MRFSIGFYIFCFFVLTGCHDSDIDQNNVSTLMPVNVVMTKTIENSPILRLSGPIVAKNDIAVSSALQGLQILDVPIDVGDIVKKGQVLAYLENNNVESQLQQNIASLSRARANLSVQQSILEEAESNLKRYQALIIKNAISHQELEKQKAITLSAQANVQASLSEIAQIEAQLADSSHQRKKSEIIAPVDGIIIKRIAEIGALTNSEPLFHIAKEGEVELQVNVNNHELSLLSKDLSAKISSPYFDRVINGKIRLIFPEIDSLTRLGKARIQLDKNNTLPIGSYAQTQIQLPTKIVDVAVPFSALSFDSEGKATVMVVDQQGKVQRKSIQIGEQNQNMVEIISGLQQGEMVIYQASAFVSEGDIVKPHLQP